MPSPFILQFASPSLLIALLVACNALILYIKKHKIRQEQGGNTPRITERENEIIPLLNFRWQETEPLQFRPFKPRYHLTMGVQQAHVSELIQIDRNYLDRIVLRRSLIASETDHVLAVDQPAWEAVQELYSWLIGCYLPQRYGDLFEIHSSDRIRTVLFNKVTNETVPINPPPESAEEALRIIGGQIEEDFLFLLPTGPGGQLVLHAYVACFPAGFDWAAKRGKTMADIHKPVPDYKKKIQMSMDRFLGRLQPGNFVKRFNWSISPDGQLYALKDLHNYGGDKKTAPEEEEEVDPQKTCLRCERQMLHRLPLSHAIVFTIRTYLYPIRSLKAEGSGTKLADAIDGLRTGSSPAIYTYKNASTWGKSVQAYLRQESN